MYLLRAKQAGFSLEEMDMVTAGVVWDVITESSNDSYDYPKLAGQKEFNEFIGG